MTSKKSSSGNWGGWLILLGSLIYLYVIFTWYGGGAVPGAWLSATQFFGPFVAAGAIVLTISLFFMSIGVALGKPITMSALWKYMMADALFVLILAAGSSTWFYLVVLGFVLTYIGGASAMM
jgi:hypothetical protein